MAEQSTHATSEGPPGLGNINESDIDLLVVLDAHRRGPVTRTLFDRAGLPMADPVSATRSASRSAGTRETDVEIRAGDVTLLVEDKIDAPFTPGQSASYGDAVQEIRATGKQAAAILICPERQQPRYETGELLLVTFEELADATEAAADPLSSSIALVLRAASRPRPGRPEDPVTRVWGEAYQAAVAAITPSITFSSSAFRTAGTDWVKFGFPNTSSDYDGPWHWLSKGLVVMYLPFEPANAPAGCDVSPTGERWRVQVAVPVVTLDTPVVDQVDAITLAVAAADQLRTWAANSPHA